METNLFIGQSAAFLSFECLYHLVNRGEVDLAGVKAFALAASVISHANGTVLECASHGDETCFGGVNDGMAQVYYRGETYMFPFTELEVF